MALNICGKPWGGEEPCELGSDVTHHCWNAADCTGAHLCGCDAVPAYVDEWIAAHADTTPPTSWLDGWRDMSKWVETLKSGDVVCTCCNVTYHSAPEVRQ